MIDKKFLESLGITEKEMVDKIVAEYGNDIQAEKDAAETLKTQLSEANTQIESYKSMDIEAVRKSAEDWEAKYKQSEADRTAFEHRSKISGLVKGLKLKDDIYENHLTNTLVEKGLKFDGDKLIGGDDIINAFRESHPDAFSDTKPKPEFVDSTPGSTQKSPDDDYIRTVMGLK